MNVVVRWTKKGRLGERKLNLLTIQHCSKMAFSAGLDNEKELRLAIATFCATNLIGLGSLRATKS